jgi:hypothetical protein
MGDPPASHYQHYQHYHHYHHTPPASGEGPREGPREGASPSRAATATGGKGSFSAALGQPIGIVTGVHAAHVAYA